MSKYKINDNVAVMIDGDCVTIAWENGFFFANFNLKNGSSHSEKMEAFLEDGSIDQGLYDTVMDYMTEYMKDLYIDTYIEKISVLVDGYNETLDKLSGSPWCMVGLYDDMSLDMIGYKAITAAEKDAPALAGFIDDDESNLGHDSVHMITLNCGVMYRDYTVDKKRICKKGKDYQKVYTSLALECEALKKAGHAYFIDTELLDQIEITAMNFQEVLEEIDGHVNPDLYAASYAIECVRENGGDYAEDSSSDSDGISSHLDYLLEHGAMFDKSYAMIIADYLI